MSAHEAVKSGMARKKKFTEVTPARFAPGTFARIEPLLGETEERANFIREAVDREIERRERELKRNRVSD